MKLAPLLLALLLAGPAVAADPPVTHSFLATGAETAIIDGVGKVTWTYPHSTRDGWVLPGGNVLLALSKSKAHPHGAAVEVTPDGKTVWAWEGTQSEVNTVQRLDGGRTLVTEAGGKPRILEIDRDGKVVAEVAIQAQTKDHHLQTRMARKLATGNYLVPQLLDKVVREYTPDGKVAWEAKTPHWAFTAIRLDDGNTLVACTRGDLVVEFDKDAKEVWRVTNDDLPGKPIHDACGCQRLPNGNTVIASYAAAPNTPRVLEVTRDKKLAWSHTDARKAGVHEVHILDTNGVKLDGRPLR